MSTYVVQIVHSTLRGLLHRLFIYLAVLITQLLFRLRLLFLFLFLLYFLQNLLLLLIQIVSDFIMGVRMQRFKTGTRRRSILFWLFLLFAGLRLLHLLDILLLHLHSLLIVVVEIRLNMFHLLWIHNLILL